MNNSRVPDKPWFRHPEPWLLFAAPLAAIVAGGFTWWIAAHSNNALVVDDYYKHGKAINQTLARDQRSTELGLSALLTVDATGQGATLKLTARDPAVQFPESIRMHLIHATRAELDHQLWLKRGADGHWRGAFAVPASGRWQLQIDDGAGQWRLLTTVSGFTMPIELTPDTALRTAGPRTSAGS